MFFLKWARYDKSVNQPWVIDGALNNVISQVAKCAQPLMHLLEMLAVS